MWFLYCPGSIKPPGLIRFLDSKLWESAASAAKSGTPKWNSQGFCWSGVDITQPSCKGYATGSLQSSLQLIPCKFNVAFLGQFIEGHVGFGKIPTLHRNISGDLLNVSTWLVAWYSIVAKSFLLIQFHAVWGGPLLWQMFFQICFLMFLIN